VRRTLALLAGLFAGLLAGAAGLPAGAQASESSGTQRYMIQYRAGKAAAVEGRMPAERSRRLRHLRRSRLMAANLSPAEVSALAASPDVERVEVDVKRYPLAESVPYGIDLIQAHAPQLDVSGAVSRTVCVIDSGYDMSHPDLPSSASFVTGHAQPGTGAWDAPGDSHGTHVAGTIAALANDSGVVGVDRNPGLRLHIVKVFDDLGEWTYSSDLIAAVESCVAAGAHVINMSLGGGSPSSLEEQAFVDAARATGSHPGALSIAAAGNAGDTSLSYPASYASVVSVAALDSEKTLAPFSQRNEQVELAAPGVGVQSTVPGAGYAFYSGTSMATPHVVGAASLLWSLHPACSPTQIRHALALAAEDLGTPGRDPDFGHGLIQVAESDDLLRSAGCSGVGEPPPPPAPEPEPEPDTPALGNGEVVTDLAQATGEKRYFRISIPAGASELSVRMTGGVGDGDLYLMRGGLPATGAYDCRSWTVGNEELCQVPELSGPVDYFAMIHAYTAFSGASLSVAYQEAVVDAPPVARILPSALSGEAPFEIVLDGGSSSDDRGIASYAWQFSDGPPVLGVEVVERSYAEPGRYSVTLTVTDTAGQTHSASVAVDVVAPAKPAIELEVVPARKRHRVWLHWSGATGRKVMIYRDGVLVKRARNKGRWRDKRSGPDSTYQVCDTEDCSEVMKRP